MYIPEYHQSWALIIGINEYKSVSSLGYARHDAEAVAEALVTQFEFPKENVTLLLDGDATRNAILDSFLGLINGHVEDNDRIFVFFAGHGYTQTGRRGEVGYLVPVDGTPDNLATLVRWDELTRNADLIPAKHMLFIMDACYGGLAITRAAAPGSMRFLKDMLQRYSRQVITAGKADEVVSDSGGPIPNHSVFTGHFLQALSGKAESADGVLTANGIMAYVYEKVAKDLNSRQTPHFGFIDGDGDFIFRAPVLSSISDEKDKDIDLLIEVPPKTEFFMSQIGDKERNHIDLIKEYISDSKFRIKLNDLITNEIRNVLYLTSTDNFPVEINNVTAAEFLSRLNKYETIVEKLQSYAVMLAHWGREEHIPILRKMISRLADDERPHGGKVVWLELRSYPTLLLIYAAGISAIASGEYSNLAAMLTAPVGSKYSGDKTEPIIVPLVKSSLELQRTEIFKTLPGHERHYVPRSEYLFKVIQPSLDDLLFLGRSYESNFDRFEALFALVYADLDGDRGGQIWGPPGRFGYKHSDRGPLAELINEANSHGENWAPLKAGLFNGSLKRFQEISAGFSQLIGQLHWH